MHATTAGPGPTSPSDRPRRVGAASDASLLFAAVTRLDALTAEQRRRLFDRGRATDPAVERAVRAIIDDVRARGDAALRDLALRYDQVTLDAIEVPRAACDDALAQLDGTVRAALEQAAAHIASFHRAQLPVAREMQTAPGVTLGRRADALRCVGVYAPGGRASYPSSVLMGVIPAKVAGVGEVVVCSPPAAHDAAAGAVRASTEGALPPAAVLAACAIAGADRVFALGGAGAVAALALGTATVPRVDKIVGPGNAYVTEAKRQLTSAVAIDLPAGPSEVLIIADAMADATLVAAELLAQAEHDPDAAAILVTTHAALASTVPAAVDRLLNDQPRADIIRAALHARGAVLVVDAINDAVRFANEYAPEHLLVLTREPRALLPLLRNAGTIFLGAASSVAFGDYITGANHVLPTAGLARAHAGLSTDDFLRWTTYQELTPAAAARLSAPTAALADAEGLPAHALAARLRADGSDRAESAYADVPAVTLRATYRDLTTYDPGRLECAVNLSDNTNQFGAAPSVRELLGTIDSAAITRYPSEYCADLKRALAAMLGVEPTNIVTGCGSDNVIDAAVRAFCEAGDVVAYHEPTFVMVPIFARANAALPRAIPLAPGGMLDVDAMLAARARITYVCRPNNPTGAYFERAQVERIGREAAGVVLVDEAYADFADDDLAQFAAASTRTIALRTMSKAYGLAGLRVGFAIGPPALVAEIEKSRGPYMVSSIAEAAALAVLARDMEWVRARVQAVRELRSRLHDALVARGAAPLETAANFLLLPVPGRAADWNSALRARGVAVRAFSALPGTGECLRVSIGPWPMLERFLDAFDDVSSTLWT
ncbi:MAG TPA: histidinol dehydrogenase [Longimicrobiales bacterium]|nr:histidinol dehydrogenase [Longimicrobiales bacterium]